MKKIKSKSISLLIEFKLIKLKIIKSLIPNPPKLIGIRPARIQIPNIKIVSK